MDASLQNLPQDVQQRILAETAILEAESDRGCILVAAALVDEALGRLLRATFDECKATEDLLSGDNPLSTFSSRINACFALGLLKKEEFDDLHTIRRIRNEAAHFERRRGDGLNVSFENEAVASRCRSFNVTRAWKRVREFPARIVFISVACALAGRIEGLAWSMEDAIAHDHDRPRAYGAAVGVVRLRTWDGVFDLLQPRPTGGGDTGPT